MTRLLVAAALLAMGAALAAAIPAAARETLTLVGRATVRGKLAWSLQG